ncbi:hypothetical protein GWK41_04095 [Persephonella atlantica]|uniref:Motility protein n=1 Tax=Persephonella atlantica TaxID=2699429 RepID=A0ABS1GH91_9AQUI|nr:hypothetical protein [Persephonella atlantica]MBK3332246.1 hypothetical protein [Persephonella atlantica]
MKVENNGMSVYKSILDMQRQMVDMLIQQNLQTDQSQQNSTQETQKPQNVISGTKVSIYA